MKFDISTWYETDVSGTLEIMDGFVKSVEQQAAESALKYEKFKETHVEGDDEYSHEVESYLGLDSDGWHLPSIFKEYIPSLYRQSAFLTVWAMFESELNKLCDRYKNDPPCQHL
jgi:hypothetical protein